MKKYILCITACLIISMQLHGSYPFNPEEEYSQGTEESATAYTIFYFYVHQQGKPGGWFQLARELPAHGDMSTLTQEFNQDLARAQTFLKRRQPFIVTIKVIDQTTIHLTPHPQSELLGLLQSIFGTNSSTFQLTLINGTMITSGRAFVMNVAASLNKVDGDCSEITADKMLWSASATGTSPQGRPKKGAASCKLRRRGTALPSDVSTAQARYPRHRRFDQRGRHRWGQPRTQSRTDASARNITQGFAGRNKGMSQSRRAPWATMTPPSSN